MEILARVWFAVFGIGALVLTAGLLLDASWATSLMPFEMSRLSRIFFASILAAVAMPVVAIAFSGELAGVSAGAVNLLVTNTGIAVYALIWARTSPEPGPLWWLAAVMAGSAVFMAVVWRWTSRMEFHDRWPVPWPVLAAFAFFAVALIYVGGSLVLVRPEIFPWPLSPELSVIIGWIFLGAACYFLHALVYRVWGNVKGQLLGFLAYDLVLIVPFLQHFGKVAAPVLPNHIVHTGVVIFSGLLAGYYIFVSRDAWPFDRVEAD